MDLTPEGTPTFSPSIDTHDSNAKFFAEIDADGSGDITMDELMHWMKGRNIELDFGATAAIIQFFDSDGDGHITLEEIEAKQRTHELSAGMMCVPTGVNVVSNFIKSEQNEPELRKKGKKKKKKKTLFEFLGILIIIFYIYYLLNLSILQKH